MIIVSPELTKEPQVSIVVCSYNRIKYIGICLDSILSQKRDFDIEIIVGDDGSTDGSRELLKEYQQKHPSILTLLFQDINLGLGGNWASCVKLARGKYVASCDDDDYWHNQEKLKLQKIVLDERENIGYVDTDYRTIDKNGDLIQEIKVPSTENVHNVENIISNKFKLGVISSVMFRRSIIEKYVPLDDYITYNYPIQDWNTEVFIASHCVFYHLPISTVSYRIIDGAMSRPKEYDSIVKKYKKEKAMCMRMFSQINIPFDEVGYDKYIAKLLLGLAYKRCEYEKAKEYGAQIGGKSIKVKCSKNKTLFYSFILMKKLKQLIHCA